MCRMLFVKTGILWYQETEGTQLEIWEKWMGLGEGIMFYREKHRWYGYAAVGQFSEQVLRDSLNFSF